MGILNEWKATDDSGKFIPHAIISNGGNPVSASNPLATTATVTADTMSVTNLNAVTTATDGASVETGAYRNKTVYVNVSVNTGAVTVNIEASPDGTTWFNYDSKTYTAITGTDSWEITAHFVYMRTTTTTQSNSTVTTVIQGRGL